MMEVHVLDLVAKLIVASIIAGVAWGTCTIYTIVRNGTILKRQFPSVPSSNIFFGAPPPPPPAIVQSLQARGVTSAHHTGNITAQAASLDLYMDFKNSLLHWQAT